MSRADTMAAVSTEQAVALARDEAAVTLARDTIAQLGEVAELIASVAETGEYALAGGVAPKPVAHYVISAVRLIAAAARGEAATR
jgi:hypothetical protein